MGYIWYAADDIWVFYRCDMGCKSYTLLSAVHIQVLYVG